MAIDALLKFEGKISIPGESVVDGHEGELDITSFSWGVTNAATRHMATGGGKGKGDISDLHLMHSTDKSGPMLMICCASGDHIDKATLTVRKAGGTDEGPLDYIKLEMTDVFVSSYQTGGSSGGDTGDSFSLNFATINFIYTPQSKEGGGEGDVTQGWDVAKGKKL